MFVPPKWIHHLWPLLTIIALVILYDYGILKF
jgi:hypothetical protein